MKAKIKSLKDLNSFIENLNELNRNIANNQSFLNLTEKERKSMKKNLNIASINAIKYVTNAWLCSATILQKHKDVLTPSTILLVISYMDELENCVKNIDITHEYLNTWFTKMENDENA